MRKTLTNSDLEGFKQILREVETRFHEEALASIPLVVPAFNDW